MLNKLIKYDLKNIYKVLIIFYILILTGAIATRFFFSFDNSLIMNIIAQICNGFTIAMIVNILINNVIRVWVRFIQNFYGDESYLTHTLPVSKNTHYLSKFLSSLISIIISIIVIISALFIAYYSKENIQIIKNFLIPFASNISITKIIILIIIIFLLEIITLLIIGFTGIILGHKKNHKKVFYSIIYSFGIYLVAQLICLLSLYICALFNKDIMNIFISNTISNINVIYTISYLSLFIYLTICTILTFINLKIFKKGVNVD